MEITRIELRPSSNGSTVAFGSVEFNEVLIVQCKLIKGANGYFVKLGEAKQGRDGKWYNSAYTNDKEFQELLNKVVVEKYKEVLQSLQTEAVSA